MFAPRSPRSKSRRHQLRLEAFEDRTVPATLKVGPAALPADTVNIAYNQTISANSGTATLTVGNVANPIPGINLPAGGTGSLTVTGTPTAPGTETFTVTADNGAGQTVSVRYALVVNPAVNLGPAALPGGSTHVAYGQTIGATNGPKIAYANQVISYTPGTLADPTYGNAGAALGGLNPVTGSYTGTTYYLTPFDGAFSNSDLVEIGAGGSLELKLARTASTKGFTLGVHTGFGLLDASYPNGQNADPASSFNTIRSADVQVSADGTDWVDLGTVTFDNPSNYDAGGATGPAGLAPGVGPLADPGKPFLGSLSTFDRLNWPNTLAALAGSAGGTWLNLSGLTDPHGNPLTGVNYVKFSVPNNPATDPNTGKPELMLVDAVVGLTDAPAGGTGRVTLTTTVQSSVPGLVIPASAAGSLVITGTPMATGTEAFTVTATDGTGATTTTSYSIAVEATKPLLLTPGTLPAATAGEPYDVQLTATGGSGSGYTFAAAGLPAGLSLSSAGDLSGTPVTASGSPFRLALTVTDSDGVARTFTRTLGVKPPPGTTPAVLPTATVGDAYRHQLSIAGASGTGVVYASGDLPGWATLSPAGLLTGTPATPTFVPLEFTVTASKGGHPIATRTYALTIDPALWIVSGPLPDLTVGQAYTAHLAPAGGSGHGYTFKATGLPSGLTLSRNGILHGRLRTVPGAPITFSVTLTDNKGGTVTYSLVLPLAPG